ncbi:MAG: sulfotransferase [Planctomycetes bacterium]|nr:sulfotransferase [Planctomycetota bacterium]
MPLAPTDLPIVQSYRKWQEQSRLLEQIQVVFIIGPPKCGTTWVQRTIDSHPEAVAKGESNFATQFVPQFDTVVRQFLKDPDGGSDRKFLDDTDRFFFIRQCMDRILIQYAAGDGGTKKHLMVVADKSPGHTRHVALLTRLYPWAKFVCCTRDVRDAAVSAWQFFHGYLNNNFFRGAQTIEHAAELYARNHWAEMLRFARAAGERIGPSRYRELSYEDHKADPHGEVRKLFEYLGLGADDQTVEQVVERNSFQAQSGGRAEGKEVKGLIRKGIVGDWRNHFSPEFGQFLIRVADERLSLGEQIVTNTTASTWAGETTASAAHAS